MSDQRIGATLFYLALLILAGLAYFQTSYFDFRLREGQFGPALWPRIALGIIAVICCYQVIRRVFSRPVAIKTPIADLTPSFADANEQSHPYLLAAGIALTLLYAVTVTTVGFLLGTFLFMVAFTYLARFRKHWLIWSVAACATLVIGLLFLRVAYISLPRGLPPFDGFTDFIRTLVGG